jgi:SAM-dependent methyltransferase
MKADQLTHVYGLEANPLFAEPLTKTIKETGLEGVYTPIICRVEDTEAELARHGVTPGTVDCVLSIQLLCSVDDVEAVVKKMHEFLKPGGEFIFWEHTVNESDWMSRIAQGVFSTLLHTPLDVSTNASKPRHMDYSMAARRGTMSSESANSQSCPCRG